MQSVLWQANIGARAASTPPCAPKPSNPRAGRGRAVSPNYPALINVIASLRSLPDHLGETRIDRKESARIRACGFTARAGLWRCPALPDEQIWWGTLWHLSDKIHHQYGNTRQGKDGYWHRNRSRPVSIAPIDPLSKFDRRFLNLLQRRGPMRRREMQRRLWRIPASIFNPVLSRLIAEGYIEPADEWVYFPSCSPTAHAIS
jgi:hypothetical protein